MCTLQCSGKDIAFLDQAPVAKIMYTRIYLSKRHGAYLIDRTTSVALIRRWPLFKHCTRPIYFFYIFIQWYTFYRLIFLWTDTKLIVKKTETFMMARAKISVVRATGVRRLFEGGAY